MNWRDRAIVREIVREQANALAAGRRITERQEGGDRRGIARDCSIGPQSEGEIRYQVVVITTDRDTGSQHREMITVWADSPLSFAEIQRQAQAAQADARSPSGPPPPPAPGRKGVSVTIIVQTASRRC